ncbi:hypothetical protein JL721_1624 [Aureococcus anophagefferens]|nr:hypothetical protein JL721_1624 [Aureococcus anophagefferens]
MSFTLTFPAGPLGLTIAPAETTGHPSVVVKTVKPGCAHGARLRAGDELVAVGATSVRELCESATMGVAAFSAAAPWRPPAPGRKSLSSPPSPPRRAGAAPAVGDAPLLVDVDVENAPRILDVDVDRSPSPAVRDIEIARLPSRREALDTGDDGLSAEVEQPETVAALEAPAPPAPEPSADPPVAADGGPRPSPPTADPPVAAAGGPARRAVAEEDRAARRGREWAFFAASVEQAATPRSDEDAAVAAAVFDFASEVLDPGEPGDDFPPLTSESSPYWPPPPEIVSEAPKSPEVADAEWRALKAGVVRSVVKAAEARLESVGADPAPRGRVGGALRLPGLAGPQSFSSDEARATEWRSWHRAHPRERKLEFAYGTPLPGLVSRAPPSESLSADTDATDDAASDMAPNAGLLIASIPAYPAKSLPLELAETVCCFCAPDGITCRGDSLSLKAEAAEAATESGGGRSRVPMPPPGRRALAPPVAIGEQALVPGWCRRRRRSGPARTSTPSRTARRRRRRS